MKTGSGRDASWGEIWLYDPDFEMVGAWAVPMLECVVHGYNDGLEANPNGEVHGVILPVPVSVMEKAGHTGSFCTFTTILPIVTRTIKLKQLWK